VHNLVLFSQSNLKLGKQLSFDNVFVDHLIWFQALCTAQKIVRESKVGCFFTFLPPSVFHVTIFDLVTDFAREHIKNQWPVGIPVCLHSFTRRLLCHSQFSTYLTFL
jgi:hypothetical protein